MFWRLVFWTEQMLGKLPMVLLMPVIGAIIGTAWAVSHPFKSFVRHGIVVSHSTFWHVLLLAVIGGVGGIVVLAGLVVLCGIAYYRVRGDSTWYASTRACERARDIELRRKVSPFRLTLKRWAIRNAWSKRRAEECWAEDPANPAGRFGGPEAFAVSFDDAKREDGVYEARWYAPAGQPRLHEIARVKAVSYDAT